MTRTFAQIMDRKHLDQLEHDVMSLTFEVEKEFQCENMEMIYALISAAGELARREEIWVHDSFDYHVIERCKRNLDRLRKTFA